MQVTRKFKRLVDVLVEHNEILEGKNHLCVPRRLETKLFSMKSCIIDLLLEDLHKFEILRLTNAYAIYPLRNSFWRTYFKVPVRRAGRMQENYCTLESVILGRQEEVRGGV